MKDFNSFDLAAPLLKALEEAGYTTPTPIQQQAIKPAAEGRDILGIAQTGTGKTAAFALPLLDRIARNRIARPGHSTRVLVLASSGRSGRLERLARSHTSTGKSKIQLWNPRITR